MIFFAGGEVEIAEYLADPLHHKGFSFDAPLSEPIELLKPHALLGGLLTVPRGYEDVVSIVNGNSQSQLSQDVVTFLRGNKMGTSKDALHGRDDALIEVWWRGARVLAVVQIAKPCCLSIVISEFVATIQSLVAVKP